MLKYLVAFSLFFISVSHAEVNIINGIPVDSVEAPWVVKININERYIQCTGSLISSRWILSAAHCFVDLDPNLYTVKGDGSGLSIHLQRLPKIKRILNHPRFISLRDTPLADIALIELMEDVKFSDTLRPIALMNEKELNSIRESEIFEIYGWGFVNSSRTTLPMGLNKIELPLVRRNDLQKLNEVEFFKLYPHWFDSRFLITYSKTYTLCNGDSGSGWIVNYAGEPRVAAVSSAGDCASVSIGNPVGPHLNWINQTIKSRR